MSALDQAFIKAYRARDVSYGAQPVVPSSVDHPGADHPGADPIWHENGGCPTVVGHDCNFRDAEPGPFVTREPIVASMAVMPEGVMVCSASTADIVDTTEPAVAVDEPPVANRMPDLVAPVPPAPTTEPIELLQFADAPTPATTAEPPARQPSDPQRTPFRPMLQVDSLVWPKVCSQMSIEAGHELNRLADGLMAGMADGCKVVTFGGCLPAEGSTTLLLGVARILSERGMKLAIVDADLADPLLCRRLGMLPEVGWEEVVDGRLPLAEAVVESIEDHLILLPLCKPRDSQGEFAPTLASLTPSIARLREDCDLVLVDMGPLKQKQDADLDAIAGWTDAVVLVCDVRTTPTEQVVEARSRLQTAGVARGAIAENFVPA